MPSSLGFPCGVRRQQEYVVYSFLLVLGTLLLIAFNGQAELFPEVETSSALQVPTSKLEMESLLLSGAEVPVIVKLRGQAAVVGKRAATQHARLTLRNRQDRILSALAAKKVRLKRRFQRLNGFVAQVDQAGLEALQNDPDVERVYPDLPLEQMLEEGIALIRGQYPKLLGFDGAGISVAVLDSGIDYTNANLGGCFGSGCKVFAGYDFANNDSDPMDDNGHGTSVAGIIAANGNHPTARVEGVATGVNLVALKIFSQSGTGSTSDLDAALDWILDHPEHGIDIVNLSLGTLATYSDPNVDPCSFTVTADAVAALINTGVVVIAASGNGGALDGISSPACIPGVIAVGAVYDADVGPLSFPGICGDAMTEALQSTCYSNSDELLSVVAPSHLCRTTDIGIDGFRDDFGGTSAAAPYVSATAALALSQFPNLTPAELKAFLVAGSMEETFRPEK